MRRPSRPSAPQAYPDNAIISGTRVNGTEIVTIGRVVVIDLPHVKHHCTDQYSWGYEGSGPADLALSILSAVIGEEADTVQIWKNKQVGRKAWDLHQPFKRELVAGWGDTWSITVGDVRQWILTGDKPEVQNG